MKKDSQTQAWPLPLRRKNELKLRQLRVEHKTQIGSFYRLRFSGDLRGFTSHSFDDHIKLFFPDEVGDELALPEVSDSGVVWPEGKRPQSRDYTPLAWDATTNSLTIDFFIHTNGLASGWAERAQIGDTLVIGGPRGSFCMPVDYAFQLYLCDETGLPAISRRLAELQAAQVQAEIHLLVMADREQVSQYLPTLSGVTLHCVPGDDTATAIAVLDRLTIPQTGYFCWVTGEGGRVKTIIDYLTGSRQINEQYLRGVAWWHNK